MTGPFKWGRIRGMNSTSSLYCLVLHPQAADAVPSDIQGLQQQLQILGLLGEPFQYGAEQRYKLGERFYQWLTFMGCAPALKLEQENHDDERFCHFRFNQPAQAVFRYLRADVRARCPHCRKVGGSAADIRELFAALEQDWTCPHCQQTSALYEIDWKQEAGIGRFFIELLDIHPHEVVPTDSLQKELAVLSGLNWRYFYSVL